MAVNMLCREVVTPLVSPQPSLSSFRAGAAVEDNEQEFMCMYIRGGRSLHFSRMQDRNPCYPTIHCLGFDLMRGVSVVVKNDVCCVL